MDSSLRFKIFTFPAFLKPTLCGQANKAADIAGCSSLPKDE
jgi:hypothetical protein